MPERRARPWWERYPVWWAEQVRRLRAADPGGRFQASAKLDAAHWRAWRGTIQTGTGPEALVVAWGAGTPFSPPLVWPKGRLSGRHQLQGGAMCLHTPEVLGAGYQGVRDIGYWLRQARDWIERCEAEGWEVSPEAWILRNATMPLPGYRRALPAQRVVALPPSWEQGPPGRWGALELWIPDGPGGLGAVLSWQGPGTEGRWQEAEQLVGPGERRVGLWFVPEVESCAHGQSFPTARERNACRALLRDVDEASAAIGRLQVHIGWVPTQTGERSWLAVEGSVSEILGTLSRLFTNPEPPRPLFPIVLSKNALAIRRSQGKEEALIRKIESANVMLVGLGALGSEVAALLAREGVRRFVLIDGDIFLPENATRHHLDLSEAGASKVEAMKRAIRRINPEAEVDTHLAWFDHAHPTLPVAWQDLSLVIGATGEEEQELILSDVLSELKVPALHAWMELQGRVLRLHRACPGRDPGLLEIATRPTSPVPRLPRAASPDLDGGCGGLVVRTGAPSDLHAAANFVARVALELLGGRPRDDNHWLFAPGGCSDLADLPALQRDMGLLPFCVAPEAPSNP